MKQFKISTILLIILLAFTSCSWEKVIEEDRLVNETKEEAEQLFEYLKNEDVENLSLKLSILLDNFFSKNFKNKIVVA